MYEKTIIVYNFANCWRDSVLNELRFFYNSNYSENDLTIITVKGYSCDMLLFSKINRNLRIIGGAFWNLKRNILYTYIFHDIILHLDTQILWDNGFTKNGLL